MLGAIIGDTVGSKYEFNNIKTEDFPLFSKGSTLTDDSIMTFAVYEIVSKGILDKEECAKILKKWGRAYPDRGYGGRFANWLFSGSLESYGSFGNGAAMRVSPVGWLARSEEEVVRLSKLVTELTHSHREGVKGATVTAMCVYYARKGKSKEFIKDYVSRYYSLDFEYEELKKNFKFNETCQKTVPEAIFCFLISTSFEDCLRKTIALGGDCDTTAAISGAIAEAYYGDVDSKIYDQVEALLPEDQEGCPMHEYFLEMKEEERIDLNFDEEIKEDTKVLVIKNKISEWNEEYHPSYSSRYGAIKRQIIAFLKEKLDEEVVSKLNYYLKQVESTKSYEELKESVSNLNIALGRKRTHLHIILKDNVDQGINYIVNKCGRNQIDYHEILTTPIGKCEEVINYK